MVSFELSRNKDDAQLPCLSQDPSSTDILGKAGRPTLNRSAPKRFSRTQMAELLVAALQTPTLRPAFLAESNKAMMPGRGSTSPAAASISYLIYTHCVYVAIRRFVSVYKLKFGFIFIKKGCRKKSLKFACKGMLPLISTWQRVECYCHDDVETRHKVFYWVASKSCQSSINCQN